MKISTSSLLSPLPPSPRHLRRSSYFPFQIRASSSFHPPSNVVVTRERDKNHKLITALGFSLLPFFMEPVKNVDQMILEQVLSAPVVAVASPSAIRVWLNLLPDPDNWAGSVACIGETTALAAKKLGLRSIYHPSSPGLQGWVDSIIDALRVHNQFLKV